MLVPDFVALAQRFDAPGVQALALVGSYARGQAGRESRGLHAPAQQRYQVVQMARLGGVPAQGGELDVERGGHVDRVVGAGTAGVPDLPHHPGLETVGEQVGKGERVAGVRVDRAGGGLADGQVVRMGRAGDPLPPAQR